jgi:hypothetical protein
VNYAASHLNTVYGESEYKWRFEILENFNGKSAIFMFAHHTFCDGMSAMQLFSYMNTKATKYSIPVIPEPNMIVKMMVYLLFPYYLLRHLIMLEQ